MMHAAFTWLEHSWLGTSVNNSLWAFAVIESVHLLALAVIGGAVLLVDLRLLGYGLRRQSVSEVARYAEPWLLVSLFGMIATGVPLLASLAASKYYVKNAFWGRMICLFLAILFTFPIRPRVIY